MSADHVTGSDRILTLSRLVNAPRELVWEVWTNPEHIKNWWGPAGFTCTIIKMDVRPGGEWHLILHGPDGTDYRNESFYTEVIKPEKLVCDRITGPKFRFTVEFAAQGNKTLITIQMLFDTKELKDKVIKEFKADVGLVQNIDKMEEYLSHIPQYNSNEK